jgi:hypothetical protein
VVAPPLEEDWPVERDPLPGKWCFGGPREAITFVGPHVEAHLVSEAGRYLGSALPPGKVVDALLKKWVVVELPQGGLDIVKLVRVSPTVRDEARAIAARILREATPEELAGFSVKRRSERALAISQQLGPLVRRVELSFDSRIAYLWTPLPVEARAALWMFFPLQGHCYVPEVAAAEVTAA